MFFILLICAYRVFIYNACKKIGKQKLYKKDKSATKE